MLRNANSMLLHWKQWPELTDTARLRVTEKLVAAVAAAPEDVKTALQTALERGEA
jgi:hypothetical protein